MMDFIAQSLKEHFKVYNIDLPGFGRSEEPKTAYSIEDYVEMLRQFVELNQIENPILIGHSLVAAFLCCMPISILLIRWC